MITFIDQATPEWLTLRLQAAGVLQYGEVISVRISPNAAFNSRAAHLDLQYSIDAPTTAPARVFLKLKGEHDGELEVKFYTLCEEFHHRLPMMVRRWAAVYDEESGNSYCLLDDVSTTHRSPVSREDVLAGNGIPTASSLEQIIDILAAFHAFWWEHANIGRINGPFEIRHWFRDDAYYQALVARREQQYDRFLSLESSWFPHHLRHIYDTAIGQLPGLWEKYLRHRMLDRTKITLTHGDCYFSQFLVPIDPDCQSAYMIDFDSVSGNLGAYDLAYLLPTFWTASQRREANRESTLLQRYHQQLLLHGVHDYAWEDLLLDYRLMVTHMLFDPFLDHNPHNRTYWWPKMECLAAAYNDLACAELL